MRANSSSTTEPPPRIDGFRIEREIARHDTTAIYDAVQVELDRPVTLTVLAPGDPRAGRFRADAWPEHPHVAGLFAAGADEGGFFIATRRVLGATTLRRRVSDGVDPAAWLADVRATLAVTGAVHGALEEETSLLVDRAGRVLITGFGLGPPDARAEDDERALRSLGESAVLGAPRARRRPARGAAAAVAGAMVAVALASWLLLGSDGGDDPRRGDVAGPVPGAVALGSAVAAGPALTADCDGEQPSGRSPACTLVQRALPGRGLVVPRDGVVVAWHVRGARGDVALRVVRPRGGTRFGVAGGSDFRTVDGEARSFRAAVPVRQGDRFGLELAPGAAAGRRTGVRGALTWRFIDPLRSESRAPDPGAGRGEELLLRVDYAPGRALPRPVRLAGAAAAAAPPGRRLDERELPVRDGVTVTVAVVVLPGGVAVDVFDETRRRARIVVPGADPGGEALRFTTKGEADLTLGWRNPDGRSLEIPFRVTEDAIDLGS